MSQTNEKTKKAETRFFLFFPMPTCLEAFAGVGILGALLTSGKGMLYKMQWELPVSCKALVPDVKW